jgi:hypothetical protein
MERTGPNGRVTKSVGLPRPFAGIEPTAEHGAQSSPDAGREFDRQADVEPRAALELLDDRVAIRVVDAGDDQADQGAHAAARDEADDGARNHAASVVALAGDVDPNGDLVDEVVQRLRRALPARELIADDVDPQAQLELVAVLLLRAVNRQVAGFGAAT